MINEKQPNLERWDDFAGEYLKADLVAEYPVVLVPINVSAEYEDMKPRLTIETEYNGRSWKLELNKTNQNFLRASGIKAPKQIIGKKLTFDKIKTRNPTTGLMGDSLILVKVE